MQRRWLIGGLGLGVVVGVVATVLVGQLVSAGGPPALGGSQSRLAVTLTDLQHESTGGGVFPQWWSDGSTALRLTGDGDDLVVGAPLDLREGGYHPAVITAPHGANPAALASLPGVPGGPWVAVAFENKAVSFDDLTTTEHPLVWIGSGSNVEGAFALPVELRSNEGGDAFIEADAAVARVGESDLAVVLATQSGAGYLYICELNECVWTAVQAPGGLEAKTIGSTGTGVVAVTAGEGSGGEKVWYADAFDGVDLNWTEIGKAPTGMRLESLQDGPDGVTLVWSDDEAVAVQTVRDGDIHDEVGRAPITGDVVRIYTAVKVAGHWLLGGSRQPQAGIAIAYDTDEATLWELTGDEWLPHEDELLGNQPDQEIRALFVDPDRHLRAVSNAPVERITMVWRFDRDEG